MRIDRGAPAVIGRREHHEPAPGCDGEPIEIGAHRTGQHYARSIIAAEHQRALERAGREHGALRDDPPDALPGCMRGRHVDMIVDALDRAVGPVIVDPEHRGAAHDPHVRHGGELGFAGRYPVERRSPVDFLTFGEQPSA